MPTTVLQGRREDSRRCEERGSIYTEEDTINPVYNNSPTHPSFGKKKDYCEFIDFMMVTADSVSPKPGLNDCAAIGVFATRPSRSPRGRSSSSGSLTHPIRPAATLLLNRRLLKPCARHLLEVHPHICQHEYDYRTHSGGHRPGYKEGEAEAPYKLVGEAVRVGGGCARVDRIVLTLSYHESAAERRAQQ